MSKEALRKFHMNLLNHCDEFLELNVDIRIIDDYALQLANDLEQALTTDRTLVEKIKTQCELHQVGKTRNEYHKGYRQAMFNILQIIKESEGTK